MMISPGEHRPVSVRSAGRIARRQHHPEDARAVELARHVFERAGTDGAIGDDLLHRFGRPIIDHCLVLAAHQPSGNVAAHAAEADDSDFHVNLLKR